MVLVLITVRAVLLVMLVVSRCCSAAQTVLGRLSAQEMMVYWEYEMNQKVWMVYCWWKILLNGRRNDRWRVLDFANSD